MTSKKLNVAKVTMTVSNFRIDVCMYVMSVGLFVLFLID